MKTVDDLREHLFAALAGLKDGTLDVERAKAISEISQTIINSAKVEVDAARLVEASTVPKFLGGGEQPMPQGITSIRQHRIKG